MVGIVQHKYKGSYSQSAECEPMLAVPAGPEGYSIEKGLDAPEMIFERNVSYVTMDRNSTHCITEENHKTIVL